MKPERNDPCPCGSGKKYKKCCYLKEQNMVAGNNLKSQDLQDNQDDFFKNQEFWVKALNSFRRFTLDKKPHIKDYYRIRKMHGEIVDAMVKYHNDGKFKQKMDTEYAFQNEHENTLYLIESDFDLETRTGAQGFYDMVIYKPAPNMNCITEDFIQSHRYRKAEKIEFLHSMLDSKLGLFETIRIDSDEGYAYLKDVFTGIEYKIIDVGLSGDKNYGEFYIYTRIITYYGISFGTGLNLIFTKTDGFIKNHIQHHIKDYSPDGEFLRFTQLYNRYSKYPDKIRVVTNTLK